MARIVLTWSNDSNVHSHQKIYKSLSVFDPNTLPSNTVTIGRDARVYEDTDVVEGFTYYYAVATVDWNGAEYLSDVLEVEAVEGGDPYWDKVVALLHFDGDLVDEASSKWDVVTGTTDFEEGVLGDALRPSGSINLVSPLPPDVTDLRGYDLTIEFFIKPSGTGNQTILASNSLSIIRGTLVRLTSSRSILFAHLGQPVNLVSSTIPPGVFTHVAICSDSESRRIYINGTLDVQDDNLSGWVAGTPFPMRIGRYQTSPTDYLQSPIDELRITKGVARYTENFNPPTAPFPNYGA